MLHKSLSDFLQSELLPVSVSSSRLHGSGYHLGFHEFFEVRPILKRLYFHPLGIGKCDQEAACSDPPQLFFYVCRGRG